MNRALITKTLLYNSSLIIDRPKEFSLDKFFDLSALCEAAILFEELISIESVDVFPEFSLLKELEWQSIIADFTPKLSIAESKEFMKQLPPFINKLYKSSVNNSFDPTKEELLSFLEEDHGFLSYEILCRCMLTDYDIGKFNAEGLMLTDNDTAEFADIEAENLWKIAFMRSLINGYSVFPSDRVSFGMSYLARSIGYLLTSYYYKIDYFPNFIRVPYIIDYLDNIYKSLPREFYHEIAKRLNTDIKEIDSSRKSMTFPIPPLTAIVLNEADCLEDIPSAIVKIREDFSSFRKKIAQLDAKLKDDINTIEERKEILKYKKRLFEELSGEYVDKDFISFKDGLSITENIVKVAVKPTDPTSYSSALLSQPVDWFRRWWVRRPITALFRVDRKVRNIRNYDLLIGKLWGYDIQKYLSNQYIKHAFIINNIFEKY